jgi:hypothetical protein
MNLDEIILLMNNYIDLGRSEFKEQDAGATGAGTSTAGTTTGYPTVTKWETGLTRSVANTIDDKVTWTSLYKTTRGKANTLI